MLGISSGTRLWSELDDKSLESLYDPISKVFGAFSNVVCY